MTAGAIRLAVIGMGKIAHDQHLPAIAESPDFVLAATVDPHGSGVDGVPHFTSLDALLAQSEGVDAVSICTPPQSRRALAARAIDAGLHVLLEKHPGVSLAEVDELTERTAAKGVTLFASWHSRFAPGVAPAREWLTGKDVESVVITWREDVRTWHPGQAWIWEPGGLGVFDPGINALSIATEILPHALMVDAASLTFPENRATPIAAAMQMRDAAGALVSVDFDWRQTGPQTWDIVVETFEGRIILGRGGALLTLPDGRLEFDEAEYPALYERFASLIRNGESDVDVAPFRLVADAFLIGRREPTEPFFD